jgi:hypothetical protein
MAAAVFNIVGQMWSIRTVLEEAAAVASRPWSGNIFDGKFGE